MKRILKRTFVIIITFVLVFAISIPCFADDKKTSPAGFNSWSLNDKIAYLSVFASDIISSVTGTISGDASSMNKLLLDLYANQPEAGVTNFYEYLANGLSFDDDTETWTLSDDLVDFCNQLIVYYNDKVTMVYRYPFRPDYLEADWFPNKTMYTYFVDMVKKHPEYYFDVFVEADNQTLSFFVYRSDDCLSAVNANFDLIYAPCALYNSEWLQDVEGYFMTLNNACTLRVFENLSSGLSSPSVEFTSFDEAVEKGTKMSFTFPQSNCMRTDNIKWSLPKWNRGNPDYLVSSHEGAINCYKSLADMKKDLGSQVVGKYTPDYTGTASNNVTQNTVNNVTNNYYGDSSGGGSGSGGGSSGSDDSGGGSSILDGFGKVFGAVGKLIDTIFGFILDIFSKLIDNVTKILDMFVGTLKKLVDLVPSGFNEFLAALFPYIPEEWKTIIEAMLLVSVLGVVIAVFRR